VTCERPSHPGRPSYLTFAFVPILRHFPPRDRPGHALGKALLSNHHSKSLRETLPQSDRRTAETLAR
jgi:hypothetical protein